MWLFRGPAIRFLALLAVAACAGCGFRPMYGTSSVDPGVSEELASVYVEPIEDRPGQLLHNALLTKLAPRGEPARPRYRLHVSLSITESKVALQKDNSASRALVTSLATYTMYQGDQEVLVGQVSRVLAYDFLLEYYADVSAADDIRRRAAPVMADAIRDELAAYFIRRKQALAAGGGSPAP